MTQNARRSQVTIPGVDNNKENGAAAHRGHGQDGARAKWKGLQQILPRIAAAADARPRRGGLAKKSRSRKKYVTLAKLKR